MKSYIVWNEAKTEGFVTTDEGLAYEVRKGNDTNCFTKEGVKSNVAIEFCVRWYLDYCSIQEIDS